MIRRILFLVFLLCHTVLMAQSPDKYYYGDLNHDGKLTVADIAIMNATKHLPEEVVVENGVIVPSGPVESIELISTAVKCSIGDQIHLIASTTPVNATLWNVKWKSSDETVATVSGKGVVTCLKLGETIISAQIDNNPEKTVSCRVTIVGSPRVYFGYFKTTPDSRYLTIGQERLDGGEPSAIGLLDYIYVEPLELELKAEGQTKDLKIMAPCEADQYMTFIFVPVSICQSKMIIHFIWNGFGYQTPRKSPYIYDEAGNTVCLDDINYTINGLEYSCYIIPKTFYREYDKYFQFTGFSDR